MSKPIKEVLAEEAEAAEEGRDEPLQPDARAHRARGATGPSQIFSVRIPADRLAELQQLARERHLTPGALVRSWVFQNLDEVRTREDDRPAYVSIRRDELAGLIREQVDDALAHRKAS